MRLFHALGLAIALAGCATHPPRMTGYKEHAMARCPSAVAGAITNYAATDDGIDLTVTAPAASAQEQIVALARLHANMGAPDPTRPAHTGHHGGPGDIGFCPIVHQHATVTFVEIPDGVRVHMAADRPGAVATLQQTVIARVRNLGAATR